MLQIKNISKQYRTGELVQMALDGVSLNLRDSEFVAILGPSGSGKTTLLNIIGGLDRYDEGDLVINGISTKEYNDRNWDTYRNHSIGFVFQSYNLIGHQTVLANVELALTISGLSGRERKERAVRALEQVGLGDQIHKKPNQMSGGQMQRVALARALVNDPEILLADEPTGALDTETSIQVMNLMKEVAKDRLVVMVTHNPELAEEYASRIVRLRDGKIIDDTEPFSDREAEAEAEMRAMQKEEQEDISHAKRRQSSMSFLTSLALSFSNLRTKKGRTILTSFAGSIGIIGIALILSLSTGVNDYIAKIQRDTMASYPITISATSFDFASIVADNGPAADLGEMEGTEQDPEKVPVSYRDMETSSAVTTSIKENNLTSFKKYLDDPESEIHSYIGENGIVYTYDVDFKVYSYDSSHNLVDTDLDVTSEFTDDSNVLGNLSEARSLMMENVSSMFGVGNRNAANFSEMMPGANGEKVSALIKDNYDLVYGQWPEKYDEVVLVLNDNGSIFSGKMYQLGLMTKAQFEAAIRKTEQKEEPEEISLRYQDLCDHEFYLLTAYDQYQQNADGTFTKKGDDRESLEELMPKALKLKISGLVKAAEDSDIRSLETTVAYTTDLTNYLVEQGNNSAVITAQKKSPDRDVLTGQAFVEDEPEDGEKARMGRQYIEGKSHDEKAELLSAIMVADYEGATQALMTTQMSAFSEQIGSALSQSIGSALSEAVGTVMEQAVGGMLRQVVQQMELAQAQAQQVYGEMMSRLVAEAMQQMVSRMATQITASMLEQFQTKIFPQIMQQTVLQSVKKVIASMKEQLGDQFPEALLPLENIASVEELQAELSKLSPADLIGVDFSAIDLSGIDFSDIDYSTIDFSGLDFSDLDISTIDFSAIDLSGIDLSGMDMSGVDLSSMDLSGMDLSNIDFSGLDFSNLDLSNLQETSGEGDMAEAVQYWLDHIANQKSLIKIYDQLIGVSNYDSNMKKFGYISYDTPSTISLYADTFEGKDGITAALKHYNDSAAEEDKITYTDYVALITSSITTIINAISYVLIGFVAVSLFVSCIMIGIITNISVLERTKEIGVLRALGASKRNISNVFNAETFIVGCFSGILGVAVSLLLTLPINAIVHTLMGSNVLSAKLPPISALILILISIVITIIGGLIPASKAARQDPVIALRSE